MKNSSRALQQQKICSLRETKTSHALCSKSRQPKKKHKKPLMLHLQPDLSLLHNATSTNQVLHIYRAYKV